MAPFNFITVRLGKDSIPDIQKICVSGEGALDNPFTINVKCTQIPDNYGFNDYAFLWLGSDNNKGMPTQWKQGFKAIGRVKGVTRGTNYNDTSITNIEIVYIFRNAINRMDILRCAPHAYYWCSSFPLIGIDDHANQTIRLMTGNTFADIKAYFYAIDKCDGNFKKEILRVEPRFEFLFNVTIPIPKDYPYAKSLSEIKYNDADIDLKAKLLTNKASLHYLAAIKTKPFLILGGFSGTGKSQKVKELAFLTCPNDDEMRKKLVNTENTPGNYCLVSVRPNWHDSTDLLGYYSSINDKYIVTDFVRFLVKAMQYKDIPFFVCLDEMNLAPVEEYFAEFLSVLESRKKVGDEILTDPLLSADWFNKKYKEYNIFDDLGLKRIGREQSKGENRQAGLLGVVDEEPFDRMDIVESLQKNGLCLPQNVVVIGTVNMDDTTNSFSRKVIDRAMTFETIVEEFGDDYYNTQDTMTYGSSKKGDWMWILPDEVRANEALEHASDLLDDGQKKEVTNFINEVNMCLKGSPFQIAYRILNETILYYRATKIVNQGEAELNKVFDDILMQKVLPRIEGDYDKTYKPLAALKTKAETKGWTKSKEKIDFMLDRFSKDDQGGFTSFWN